MEETKIIQQDSVSIEKNSRGFTYSVKAHGETPDDIQSKLAQLTGIAQKQINKAKLSEEL